jgi:hypothetical protein
MIAEILEHLKKHFNIDTVVFSDINRPNLKIIYDTQYTI